MTVKDIALAAAQILQAEDIESEIQNYVTDDETDTELDADAKTMIRCVNLALAESDTDMPVLHTATVAAVNGLIPLEVFDGEVSTIRAVMQNGRHVRFALDTRGIAVDRDGEYNVTYTVAPSDKNLDDVVSAGVGMDRNVLCYLAARNYCLVTGRSDEAAVWDQRYNAELEKLRILRRAYIPQRKWK